MISFSVPALAQTTYSCPSNQYVTTQLVNTGQGCAVLPASVTNVSGANSGGFIVSTTNPASTPVVSVAPDGTHYMPTATDQANWNAKQAAGTYVTTLTGDITASGPGSAAATLATVNTSPGSCGDATHVSQLTVNAKGLTTGCTPIAITGGGGGSVPTGTGFTHVTSGAQDPAARAVDVSSSDVTGTLAAARTNSLTGDVTKTAGSLATTVTKVNGGIIPTSTGYTYLNPSGQFIPVNRISKLWGFGDSFISCSSATIISNCSFSLLARDTPAPNTNNGVAGTTAPAITAKIFSLFAPDPNNPSVSDLDGGANDGTGDACGGGTGTACMQNYLNAMMANEAWLTIPYQFRQLASVASKTGTWVVDTGLPLYISPTLVSNGTAEKTSTSGATLTFSIPSSASPVIGITSLVINAQTGTYTVKIDGTLQTDICSGTTTFSSGPCAGQALVGAIGSGSFFRQEFPVTPGISHTVLITTTAASNVSITSVDWVPPASTTNENIVFVQSTGTAFTNATNYNIASAALAAQLLADGLPVYYVNLTSGTPGLNNTTDISLAATSTCPASGAANHPNDCGYAHILATINNIEDSTYRFSFYQGGGENVALSGQLIVPPTYAISGLNNGVSVSFGNVNTGALSSRLGTFFYNSGANGAGIGFGQDGSTGLPWSSKYNMNMFGASAWYNCFSAFNGTQTTVTTNWTAKWCESNADGSTYQLGSSTAPQFIATQGENTVTYSATPTFNATYLANILTLTGNVTSSTLAAGNAGQSMTLTVCENGTGGFIFVAPTNVKGLMTLITTANTCNSQIFAYHSGDTSWGAASSGSTWTY